MLPPRARSAARLLDDQPGETASAAADVSCAVFVSGANDHGALSLPFQGDSPMPTRVLAMRSHFTRCIAAGAGWSACGTASGHIYAWGPSELPAPLEHAALPSSCAALAIAPKHAYMVSDEGELHACEHSVIGGQVRVSSPQRVPLPVDVSQLACGDAHVLALADGGVVFSWGRGVERQGLGWRRSRGCLRGSGDACGREPRSTGQP